METQNIYNIFSQAAQQYSANKAIVSGGYTISYGKLHHAVQHKATELTQAGITKGDTILVFIPMSVELYVFLLATFKIGAVAVFVDEWANKERLNNCLTKVPCKGFAGGFKAQLLRRFYKPLKNIPVKLSSKINTSAVAITPPVDVTPNDKALITFTTGSTSIPKAANRTHGFLQAQYNVLINELNTQPHHIDFIGLPIVVLCNLGSGATSVLPNYNLKKLAKIKPQKVQEYLREQNVNRVINSPSFFIKLAEFNGKLPEVTNIFTGGAPVFPKDVEVFKRVFSSASIHILYGSTEAEPISEIKGDELLQQEQALTKHGLCVGKINKSVSLKLIQKTTKKHLTSSDLKTLESDNIGEILVAGNHVLKEYVNSEEDTKQNKIKDGDLVWHRTGDAGIIKNGQLYLQGRINNIFELKGETISPFIYEYLFKNEANITYGTIMQLNNQVVAFVEPKTWSEKDVLEKQLKTKYPIIERVFPVKKIPLDARHNSKIDYAKLKLLM